MKDKTQKATFAAGCFWGVEEEFRRAKGVIDTRVGYAGGRGKATYEQVCSGKTGHTESVEVTFDPAKILYDELLGIFWRIHDPTQKNRQGPDVGTQYRSVIFYHNENQKKAAEKSKQERQKNIERQIVTEIVPAKEFHKAEEYHQRYLEKRGRPFC